MATVIFLTSGTSWTVPSDWNSLSNKIEALGGGAGGDAVGGAGGGGAYSAVLNLALTAGAAITYQIAPGGAASVPGGDTFFNGASFGVASVAARGGSPPTGVTGGQGGQAGAGIGTTTNSGGSGGSVANLNPGGGGGAGGPNGAGQAGSGGALSIGGAGGSGDNGVGGAGGAGSAGTGSAGGTGAEWTQTSNGNTAAPGGGGGGGIVTGGVGGNYGGGGGGGLTTGGAGAQGIIVITYTPVAGVPSIADYSEIVGVAHIDITRYAFIGGSQPYAPKLLNEALTAVPVNNPPFGAPETLVISGEAVAAAQPDPWRYVYLGPVQGGQPYGPRQLNPSITAVAVNNPPFDARAQQNRAIVMQWQPNPWQFDVLGGAGGSEPFGPRLLNPSITNVAVNNPPFDRRTSAMRAEFVALWQPESWQFDFFGGREPFMAHDLPPPIPSPDPLLHTRPMVAYVGAMMTD